MTQERDRRLKDAEKNIENFELLSRVSTEALVLLKRGKAKLLDETRNFYLGRWERVEMDKGQFSTLAPKTMLDDMSIEVISALSDMADHVHYHNDSYALLTILGEAEGYPEPKGCKMFFKSTEPSPAFSGVTLQVEPGVIHSFSNGKTPLCFLSVQSKKIDNDYQTIGGAA